MIRRKRLSIEEYQQGILSAKTAILSQAITLVESKIQEDRDLAGKLLDSILPHTGKSTRIGITGVPGVGKSTFIESFGSLLTANGHKVAVLAVDPTSQRSGGSILGDKTRMDKLSADPNAFIRPSAAGSHLGGVASATREAMLLCEAAGYNIIIIETVGVGQSETAVRNMVDFFLLLMLAGAGDELQGIKRGIMEMADAVVINKADQENKKAARRAKAEYQTALHYLPPSASRWQPKVHTCSALENIGIDEVWNTIKEYMDQTKENSFFTHQRQDQNLHWLHDKLNFLLKERYYSQPQFKERLHEIEKKVTENKISPSSGAQELAGLINQ
ncbi:MAG: methylmalonyl Co-A mutase-associated GTPase MeaB [Candidatus Cyclobacteriaceae bacterium M2_1C_046]